MSCSNRAGWPRHAAPFTQSCGKFDLRCDSVAWIERQSASVRGARCFNWEILAKVAVKPRLTPAVPDSCGGYRLLTCGGQNCGMRASITSVIVPGRLPRRRTVMLGIVLLLFAVSLGYGAMVGQRAWNAQLEHEAAVELRASNERRAASRYADVKVPLKGEMCTAYSFDNKDGGFVGEREAACDPAPLPRRTAPSGEKTDGAARFQGISNAFRKQQ